MGMSNGSGARMTLAQYLVALRSELAKVYGQDASNGFAYFPDGLTLELDITYARVDSRTASSADFWVLGPAGQEPQDGVGMREPHFQRLTLRWSPVPPESVPDEPAVWGPRLPPEPVPATP